MVIKDMLYLIHAKGLAEHASPSARSQHKLAFVDLEKSCSKVFAFSDPVFLFSLSYVLFFFPLFFFFWLTLLSFVVLLNAVLVQLLSETEENGALHEFLSIQDLFSANFPVDADVDLPIIQPEAKGQMSEIPEGTTMDNFGFRIADGTSLVIDLSTFLESAQIALPSLNG